MTPAIETTGLTKRFEGTTAVDGLDLAVRSGEFFGFLGPNGAGKSTTVGLLLNYLRPTAGTARLLGHDPWAEPRAVHDRVGVVPDRVGLYVDRSARRHVSLVVGTKGTDDDPATLLDRVGLGDAADAAVGGFSQGMLQRLLLAMALVGSPDLLVLDEPFSGLDAHGVRRVREIIGAETDRGATVFLSSHVLGQIEPTCDRVGILHRGRLVAEGPLADLRERHDLGPEAPVEEVFLAATADSSRGGER